MKRFSSVLSLVMALCLISANVMAQDEPGGRPGRGGAGGGPGGQGGFGGRGGMMGGMGAMGGGAMALLGLLRMEEVRKEVNVSADAYDAIQKAQRDAFSNMGNLREASEEDRAKAMKDLNTKAQEMLEEVVDPAGLKRLMGLLLQQQGNSAVMNELVAKEVGLKEAEVKALGETLTKSSEESREKMREMFQGGGGPPDREKMTEMMAEMRKKTDATINEKLTAEQKKAVEALKGEKFTFPEGGGFGRGGAGGPGGGRTRPNSDN